MLVIGAGFSGVGMGIKLKEAGIPFTIIEKNDDVGGTWYENTYPGIGVDTANHFYSYSFDNNNDWDHFFAKGDEIEAYIRRNADRTDLRKNIRFSEEVLSLTWDEAALLWRAEIRKADGEIYAMTANAVVSAVGMLNRPKMPEIEGLESFAGPKFHTARWDHSVDYKGKRVGMIGTGASGMQVGPAIAAGRGQPHDLPALAALGDAQPAVFREVTDAKKWVLKNIPFYTKWFRFQLFWSSSDTFHHNLKVDPDWPDKKHTLNAANAEVRKQLEAHIAEEVGHDPELIRKATPDYPPYGKRMLRDNHWYRMLTRAQRRSGRRADRSCRTQRRRHHRRHAAPVRHSRACHRVRNPPNAVADADRRPRRRDDPRALGRRRPARASRHHGAGISELLPDLWSQHQPVAWRQRGVPFRMPDPLHHAGPARTDRDRPGGAWRSSRSRSGTIRTRSTRRTARWSGRIPASPAGTRTPPGASTPIRRGAWSITAT